MKMMPRFISLVSLVLLTVFPLSAQERNPQRPNQLHFAVDAYMHSIRETSERARRFSELAERVHSARRELDDFQVSIALQKAKAWMEQALRINDELQRRPGPGRNSVRAALILGDGMLKDALMNPHGTDMVALKENFHHQVGHPVLHEQLTLIQQLQQQRNDLRPLIRALESGEQQIDSAAAKLLASAGFPVTEPPLDPRSERRDR